MTSAHSNVFFVLNIMFVNVYKIPDVNVSLFYQCITLMIVSILLAAVL